MEKDALQESLGAALGPSWVDLEIHIGSKIVFASVLQWLRENQRS